MVLAALAAFVASSAHSAGWACELVNKVEGFEDLHQNALPSEVNVAMLRLTTARL